MDGQTFRSRLTRGEKTALLLYLPVHLFLLPTLLEIPLRRGSIDGNQANFLCYAVGAAFMLLFLHAFLRRDFDPLCERLLYNAAVVFAYYLILSACNLLLALLLSKLTGDQNPNNAAIIGLAQNDSRAVRTVAVLLAPITEELLFRAGIFGSIRERNRTAAYVVSILAFSLCHVWQFILTDIRYLVFIVHYLPVSFLLCRCYERTESIWCPIAFHSLVNALSLRALRAAALIG